MSYQGSKQNAAAQEKALAAQQETENLRQQQMNLDAARKKREIVRASMQARSAALATTTAQGVAGQGGSSLQGAYGSIAGRTGVNWLGVDQNQQIGNSIFASHQNQLEAYKQAASAQSTMALGAGLSSLGGAILSNAGTIGKVGTYVGAKAFSAYAGGGTPSGYGAS
jgi:hypothetical protein